jgi:hypothetical protein
MQHDPSLAETAANSTFVGFREVGNATQWLKGFERSLAGFIPLLSLGGDIKGRDNRLHYKDIRRWSDFCSTRNSSKKKV